MRLSAIIVLALLFGCSREKPEGALIRALVQLETTMQADDMTEMEFQKAVGRAKREMILLPMPLSSTQVTSKSNFLVMVENRLRILAKANKAGFGIDPDYHYVIEATRAFRESLTNGPSKSSQYLPK